MKGTTVMEIRARLRSLLSRTTVYTLRHNAWSVYGGEFFGWSRMRAYHLGRKIFDSSGPNDALLVTTAIDTARRHRGDQPDAPDIVFDAEQTGDQ